MSGSNLPPAAAPVAASAGAGNTTGNSCVPSALTPSPGPLHSSRAAWTPASLMRPHVAGRHRKLVTPKATGSEGTGKGAVPGDPAAGPGQGPSGNSTRSSLPPGIAEALRAIGAAGGSTGKVSSNSSSTSSTAGSGSSSSSSASSTAGRGSSSGLPPDIASALRATSAGAGASAGDSAGAASAAPTSGAGSIADPTEAAAVVSSFPAELRTLSPSDLTNTLWAYTLSKPYDAALYEGIAQVVASSVRSYEAGVLVEVLCAFAEARHRSDELMSVAAMSLAPKVDTLPAPSLTNLVWSCALLQFAHVDLLTACAKAAAAKASELPPADLAKIMAALAALSEAPTASAPQQQPQQPPHTPLVSGDGTSVAAGVACLWPDAALAMAAPIQPSLLPRPEGSRPLRTTVEALPPPSLAQAVWAMAKSGHYDREFFDAAGHAVCESADELEPQQLSNVAWAFSAVREADRGHRGIMDKKVFEALAAAARSQILVFPTSDLISMLMAFSSLPFYDAPFYDHVANTLTPRIRDGDATPQQLVVVGWAVSKVEHKSQSLMSALGDTMAERLQAAAERARVANAAAAAAAVVAPSTGAPVPLRQAGLVGQLGVDGDDLVTLAAAFPVTRTHSDVLFQALLEQAAVAPWEFGPTGLLELAKVVAAVQHHDPERYGPALDQLLRQVREAFVAAGASLPTAPEA